MFPASNTTTAAAYYRSKMTPTFWFFVVVFLLGFTQYRYMYTNASPNLIFLIQHVTVTSQLSVKEWAEREPSISADSAFVRLFLSTSELEELLGVRRQQAIEAAKLRKAKKQQQQLSGTPADLSASEPTNAIVDISTGSRRKLMSSTAQTLKGADDVADSDEKPVPQNPAEATSQKPETHHSAVLAKNTSALRLPYATMRFQSKQHMINQIQLLTDYPVGFYLCERLGFAYIPGISANLISLLHPVFACAAAYCFYKALRIVKGGNNHLKTSAGEASTGGISPMGADGATTNSGAKHRRTHSVNGTEVEMTPLVGTGQAASAFDAANGAGNTVTLDILESSVNTPHLGNRVNSTTAISVDHAPTSPLGANASGIIARQVCEDARKEKASRSVVCVSGNVENLPEGSRVVSLNMIRLGCLLWMTRNFLDGLDGIIARLHRLQNGRVNINGGATTIGFNGHTVDVITDIVGGIIILLSILYLLVQQEVFIDRAFHNLLYRFGLRWHTTRSLLVGKIVALLGLGLPAFIGGTWESWMMGHHNLFDTHAPNNLEIFNLEQNFHVRLNQYLWFLLCGDFVFSVYITALVFNRIWPVVQCYCFFGFAAVASVNLYSLYVWYVVILGNPTAAALVAEFEASQK